MACISSAIDQTTTHPSPVGAWRYSDDDGLIIFFPDGTLLSTFLSLSDKQASNIEALHSMGSWLVNKNGEIETKVPQNIKSGQTIMQRHDLCRFSDNTPDILISAHGGSLKRVIAKPRADKNNNK